MDGGLELLLRLLESLQLQESESPGSVGLGKFGIQLERPGAGLIRPPQLGPAGRVVHVRERYRVGDAGPRQGELRIHGHRALEHLAGIVEALPTTLAEELATSQVEIVGLDVVCRVLRQRRALLRLQDTTQGLHHIRRDLVLDIEHVLHLAVVALGPQVIAAGHLDQLRRDPQPVSRPLNAALENGPCSKLPADRSHVAGLALVGERGCARHDVEPLHVRQFVGDLLADPIAQVLVLGVGAEVGERENHDVRGSGRRGRDRCSSTRSPAPALRMAEVPGRASDDGEEQDPRADDEVGRAVREIEAPVAQSVNSRRPQPAARYTPTTCGTPRLSSSLTSFADIGSSGARRRAAGAYFFPVDGCAYTREAKRSRHPKR